MNRKLFIHENLTYSVLYGIVFSFLLIISSFLIITFENLFVGLALLLSSVIVLFFSIRRNAEILIVASVASVTFLTLYFPILGFTLGYTDQFLLFELKAAVGIRSVIYSFLLLAFALIASLSSSKINHYVILSLIVVGFLFFSFISSSSVFLPKVTYLINTFVPLFFTYIGVLFLLDTSKGFINQTIVFKALAFFILVSLIYFIGLDLFYDVVRPDLISAMRSKDGTPIEYGTYPGSWGSMIAGVRFNRFVGSFPDPILFGYFVALMAVFLFSKKSYLLSAFFVLMILLSGAKGALLLFINSLFLVAVFKYFKRFRGLAVIGLVAFQVFVAMLFQSSASIHLEGLLGAINSVLSGSLREFLFGYGIGGGGNLARFSEDAFGHGWLESGSESGVGVLLYQLGIVGGLVYIYIIYLVDSKLIKLYQSSKDTSYLYALAAILAVFINSFMQENCINASILSMLLLTVIFIVFVRKKQEVLNAAS